MDFWSAFWLFIIIFLVIELPLFTGAFSASPWLPTSKKDLPRINRLAALKPGQVFFDIGCGDGRICSYIGAKNPQAKVFGYEIAYPVYLLAKLRSLFKKNVTVKMKDIFKVDFSKADVIFFWGIERGVEKLKPKFAEMKKGSKIILYSHKLPGREADLVDRPAPKDGPFYVYEV